MKVVLSIDPSFDNTVAELSGMAQAVIAAADKGLQAGAKEAAGHVVRTKLSGSDIKRRTGNLARAVDAWPQGPLHAVVGVREDSAVNDYAWILGDETKTITPKKGRFLAIPIGEGLTPSGVARYGSPREVEDGFFVRTGGNLLFGIRKGTTGRGRFRPLFIMKRSVTIRGRGSLAKGVAERTDAITGQIQSNVDQAGGGI